MEHVKEGRKLTTPAGMLPQEVWLNRLIAMEETPPRGKFLTDSAAATKTSSMTWPPIISVLSERKSDRGIDESPAYPPSVIRKGAVLYAALITSLMMIKQRSRLQSG